MIPVLIALGFFIVKHGLHLVNIESLNSTKVQQP